MSQSATCVARVYKGVIEDVINGARELFLDEGIDEQVLVELKQTWETKLDRMNVIDHSDHTTNANVNNQSQAQQPQQQQQQQQPPQQLQQQQQQQPQQQPPQQPTVPQSQQPAARPAATTTVNLVPVQITVPAQQAGGMSKTITIHVPSTALTNGVAGLQLQAILSSPTAAHTFSLEASQAAEIIQRKLNQALEENGITLPPQLLQYNNVANSQVDGACDEPLGQSQTPKKSRKKMSINQTQKCSYVDQPSTSNADSQPSVSVEREVLDRIVYERLKSTQVDGLYGTGDSSSEISDDDDDDDDDKDAETERNSVDGDDDDDEADGPEEDPLNSEDDVSDDDTSDMFDTDNVVVCQYDKVTRVRNKWKFTLKDGIMNLRGKDYVFQKATGDGEW
ncbi:Transcription initiation factor IIA subunit 1 [Halocaridina rubra]|uniref:Transcription initiation factor IIA subunit 1 n=1 Tax=Halocaridina rubra TaxID=373956 RepID=A0AAN8WLT6_HALRR